MVEILAKVFSGLAGSVALLFIVYALFVPGYSFLNGLEKDEEKGKTEQKKLEKRTVIFGCIVIILAVIALVLAILSR